MEGKIEGFTLMGKGRSILLRGEEAQEFIYKLSFLIIWGSFPNKAGPPCSDQSWFPGQRAPSGRETQEANSLHRNYTGDLCSGVSWGRWPLGLAKKYGCDTDIVCFESYLNLFLFTHFSWGGKIPEQAHLHLQRRFLLVALFLWSRSSRLGLWAAPGSFSEPSSFHRRPQCGPSGTGLWW